MLWEDFSIKIEPRRGDVYPVIVLRSPAGEGRSSFSLPFDPDEIGDILFDLGQTVRGVERVSLRDVSPAATRTGPQKVGDQLFNALFSGPVRSLLDRSLGMIHGRERGLRIKLHIDPEDPSLAILASLPWEFLYRKETRDFLNLSRYSPVIRYLNVQRPTVPLPLEPPLRILVVISAPTDYLPLDLDREKALIETSWARQKGVQVEFMEQATIFALQDRLNKQPYHVLHYMGHGDFDERTGQGVLVLEDEAGNGAIVDGGTLAVLLRDVSTMRLVFLNACETARATKEKGLDPFAGVASALVMAAIPAVVAMQFPISDQAAITFAQKFYPLLARGEPVDAAVAEGRRAIRLADASTNEWGTPVLFLRAPKGNIFEVREKQDVEVSTPELTEIPPLLDKEFEQRLEQLYTDGLSAFWLEKWERAIHNFQTIVNMVPEYEDAADRLTRATHLAKIHELYDQATAAQDAEEWSAALEILEELAAEAPDFKDTQEKLQTVVKEKQLEDLHAEAKRLYEAKKWQAVINCFTQIRAINPDYPDPEGLQSSAEREFAEQRRLEKTNKLYRRAIREMRAKQWDEARQLLIQVNETEPDFQDSEKLLARVDQEIAQLKAEQEKQERLARLYNDAVGLASSQRWKQVLSNMDEIMAIEPTFSDPEGIAEKAREEIRKKEAEAEARRQSELEALYDKAVNSLKAGEYQAAMDNWKAVQSLDPHHPDLHQVEATALQALDALTPAAPLRRTLPKWVWIVGGVIVGCGVLLIPTVAISNMISAGQANATSTAQARARAVSTSTALAQDRATTTAVAQDRATATASAREDATATALAVAAGLPRPTRTSIPPTDLPQTGRVFGPESASLQHEPDDGLVEALDADVTLTDFVAEATFFNPYSLSTGGWDYGFLGRNPRKDTAHAVRVRSDGDWSHSVLLEGEWTAIETGELSGLRTGADQSNHLRLIVIGDDGLFFVNDQLVATLDMSDPVEAGDVAAVTGTFSGREIEGEATRVEDFSIWSLDVPLFGPTSGTLVHDPDNGNIEDFESNVYLTDFLTEARFYNPYSSTRGNWDYGFMSRYPDSGTAHVVRLRSDGDWVHSVILDGEWSVMERGAVNELQTGAGQSNHVRILVFGDIGVLYVNGQIVSSLDMSWLSEAGDVEAVTGTYTGYEIEGEATQFEGFTVWSLD